MKHLTHWFSFLSKYEYHPILNVILFHQQDSKDNKTVPKEQKQEKQEKQDKNDAAEKYMYVVLNDCCIGIIL